MAHLFLGTDSDSVYLDVTAGERSPVATVEPASGVCLHLDRAGAVVAVEVLGLGRRGDPTTDEPGLGHLHVSSAAGSLYLDVSAGARSPVRSAAIADGVHLHVDGAGELVGIEVRGLSGRGGLRVDDLDAPPRSPRPPLLDEIERAASDPAAGPPPA